MAALTGRIEVRFADTTLLTQAIDGAPCAMTFGYALPSGESLTLTAHAVYLPRPRIEIAGPQIVQAGVAELIAPGRYRLARLLRGQRGTEGAMGKAYTNYDNYVGVGTWTKIAINDTDANDQGAFDAASNRFVAPVAGDYLFGATLMYKVNSATTARLRGRLVLNGTAEIRGSFGEAGNAAHVSLATALWLQTLTPLAADDTVELQASFRTADGYVAAEHTSFWGCKIG